MATRYDRRTGRVGVKLNTAVQNDNGRLSRALTTASPTRRPHRRPGLIVISIDGPPAGHPVKHPHEPFLQFPGIEHKRTEVFRSRSSGIVERRLRHGRHHGDRRSTRLPKRNCQAIALSVHCATTCLCITPLLKIAFRSVRIVDSDNYSR